MIWIYLRIKIEILKAEGKLKNLVDVLEKNTVAQNANIAGIGHIRWATHGIPNEINAHPHLSNCGKIALVHNGIIENYKELRAELEKLGHKFHSQTDTETIVHLIAQEKKTAKDIKMAVQNALKKIQGAYALCVICLEEQDKIIQVIRDCFK